MKEDDSLKAIGITSSGKIREFEITSYGELYCYNCNLVSLEIPEGVELELINCENNQLTKLNIQLSVKKIVCSNNLLTELHIPEGVEYLNCHNNLLTELTIPNTLKTLRCDRNVKGLDNIHSECDLFLF